MKKLTPFLFLTFVIVQACSEENDGQVKREFIVNSELNFVTNPHWEEEGIWAPAIETGQNLVFRFTFVHPEEPNIADDELTEVFFFEVPKDSQKFEYSSIDIGANTDIPAGYFRHCFCFFGSFNIKKATISAQRINEQEWQVAFDVVFENEHEEFLIKDKGIYVLAAE